MKTSIRLRESSEILIDIRSERDISSTSTFSTFQSSDRRVGADLLYVLLVDVEDGNAFSAFATVGMSF